jgi:hypothetical protein
MGTEFKDRKGRTVTFDVDDGCVQALYGGQRIGEFTLRIEEDPFGDVVHADVIDLKEEFRKEGIGREMVRQAFEHHGQPIIPPATYYPEKDNRKFNVEGRIGAHAFLSTGRVGLRFSRSRKTLRQNG